MKQLQDVLTLSTQYLEEHGVPDSRRQAEELVCDGLGVRRLDLYTDFERPLTPEELTMLRERLQRRGAREPAAYIQGEVEFYDATIQVTPAVLIPRQETELLVDKIAKEIDPEGTTLWDVCCGSGCIGIALKKKFPQMRVILSDISGDALAVARRNAEINGVEVEIKQGDLLDPFDQVDYVVCNPPYVTEEEHATLDPEVKGHEPRTALVSGPTGLEFYRRLAEALHLKATRKAWLELGTGQGERVNEIFDLPYWKKRAVEKDWAGHDRFFSLAKE
jgi:release factor glutamine methyltransferase